MNKFVEKAIFELGRELFVVAYDSWDQSIIGPIYWDNESKHNCVAQISSATWMKKEKAKRLIKRLETYNKSFYQNIRMISSNQLFVNNIMKV